MIPELLSPVSNLEQVKIAVISGASSIYLSGKKYSARRNAGNLTLKEIEKAVNYAHLHNVKVYITVNTLIKENEIKDCLKYIYKLYCLGIDAILIQDIGLISLIRKYIPKLEIHASTQMKIKNTEEIKWAHSNGIKRIVLPRELNLEELKTLTKTSHDLGLEVELFIHGAQCYSYSGNCLLSSFIGGRSGNRGVCGQACRKPYTIKITNKNKKETEIKTKNPYILSPKDLNLYNKLEILKNIKIDCLKIEGRMRSNQYLMTTTTTYRQGLNHINRANNPKYEKFNKKAKEELNQVFNRKSTTGHLFIEETNKIMNPEKPGHYGLYIGKITEYENNKLNIKLVNNLQTIPKKGDGLMIKGENLKTKKTDFYGFDISGEPNFKKSKRYWKKNKLIKEKAEDNTLIIKKVKENKKENIKIEKGCEVYLSKRNKINKKLKELENNPEKQMFKKSILKIQFYTDKNYPILKGTVKLGNNKIIKYKHTGDTKLEKAKNKPLTKETIKKQLSKINNPIYYIEKIDINIAPNLFTPLSKLNQLRREFIANLNEKIKESYLPNNKDQKTVQEKIENYKLEEIKENEQKEELSIYINSLKTLKQLDKKQYQRVYYEIPPKKDLIKDENKLDISYCVKQLKKAIEITKNKDFELIWLWPTILEENLLENHIKIIGILNKTHKIPPIMTSQLGLDKYLEKFNIQIYGDYFLNIINNESIKMLENYKQITLSPELGKTDYKQIKIKDKTEILIHGNIISMISLKNPFTQELLNKIKTLNNPNNPIENIYLCDGENKYPLHTTINNKGCIILNSKDYSIIQYINYLKSENFNKFSIDGRWKNIKEINKIYELYTAYSNNNLKNNKQIDKYTTGNFKRGLI